MGLYQRRVGHMRLLGELYNYRLMDSRCLISHLSSHLSSSQDISQMQARPHQLIGCQAMSGTQEDEMIWIHLII